MVRASILDQIRALDPERDHQRIVFLSTCYEFPFDTTRALEFALFRTFCVPSIAGLLDRTGEFRDRAQKRYDDTDIIVSELTEHGYDSERGGRALVRMNQQHGRFKIANDDFLYVLSTFVYEPIRWNARCGWRPMCDEERLAMFYFWRQVGLRMGVRDIPADYGAFERYNIDYEQRHFRFSEANRRVGAATVNMFASWFPRPLHPLVRRAIHALLDDRLIDGFGFPAPAPGMRRLLALALRLRRRVASWLPPRRRPRLRTAMRHRSYPRGYRIEELGPPVRPPPGEEAAAGG
jgi:mpaB/rubber oxygenase-like protein